MRALAVWFAMLPLLAAPASGQPNVLLILADDVGVDLIGAYGEGPDPAKTPVVDGLAAGGILFRNAWSNPNCSPTRRGRMPAANIETQKHLLGVCLSGRQIRRPHFSWRRVRRRIWKSTSALSPFMIELRMTETPRKSQRSTKQESCYY